MDRPARLPVLDAVRGLAAVAVVLHHILLAFWPYLADGGNRPPAGRERLAHVVADSPAAVLHDGSFAVVVFFVLSGFVLAYPHLRRPNPDAITTAALRRYFRLAGPAMASVLISYGLLRAGAYRNAAATAAGASAWLGQWYRFTPHLLAEPYAAVPRGLLGTFLNGSGTAFNNVLWTMAVELPGSLLVFATVALFGTVRRRWIIYAAGGAALAASSSLLVDFVLGTAMADLYLNGPRPTLRWSVVPLLAAAACVCRRGIPLGDDQLPGPSFGPTVAAVAVVAVPLLSPMVHRLLSRRSLAWLGRISFGLYLTHMLVLASVGSATYTVLRPGWSHDVAALFASAVTVGVSLLAGWGLYHAADRPSVWVGRKVVDALFSRRSADAIRLPVPATNDARRAA